MRLGTFTAMAAAVAMLAATAATEAVTVTPLREQRIFPFRAEAVKALRGQAPGAGIIPAGNILGGPVFRLDPVRQSGETEVWVEVDVPLDSRCRRVAWWMLTRGGSWCNVRVAVQEPSGRIGVYRAPSSGDSPWTRYEWTVEPPEAAVGTLGREAARGDGRRFRGWVLRFPPFAHGPFTFGDVELDRRALPRPLDYAWTFRDVDESRTYQLAFTGFNLAAEGTDAEARMPLPLWLNGAADAVALRYLICTVSGRTVDRGTIDLKSCRDRKAYDLVLPTLPPGNYWVRVRQLDGDGAILGHFLASYLVNHSPVKELPPAPEPEFSRFWPRLAAVELTVPEGRNELTVPVRELKPSDRVRAVWTDYAKKRTEQDVAAADGSGTLRLTLPQGVVRPAMLRLELRLQRDGRWCDRREATVLAQGVGAVRNGPLSVAVREYFPLEETETVSMEQEGRKRAFVRHLAADRTIWAVSFNWDEIEPVPGFICYPLIDRCLEEARRAGVPVMFTVYVHLDRSPRPLWYESLQDQYGMGKQYNASFIRKISPCAVRTWSALRRTIRELVGHYRGSSEIAGWNFSQGVESFWSDASRNRRVVGYSRSAATAFQGWLRERGWTLDRLSLDYGRDLRSWDEVTPPPPVFGDAFDLRPAWLAWEEFRQQVPSELFASLFAAVREIDRERILKQYAGMGLGDLNLILPVFRRYRAQVCFGGGESLIHALLQSLCRQAGVPLVGESSAVPPYSPAQLYTMFIELAYGELDGGINIMWGRNFGPDGESAAFLTMAAEAARVARLVREVGPTELVPANAAVGMGMRSIVNRSRSFMWTDWCNLNSCQFMDALGVPTALNLQTGFVTENSDPAALRQWPILVFTESPLLSDAAAARLDAYVRGGGTLVLMGRNGIYDQSGRPTTRLRDLLGTGPGPEPVVRGKGRVWWLEKPLRWQQELLPLLAKLGYRRPVRVSEPRVRCALRRRPGQEDYLLVLFGKTWSGGNPRAGEVGRTPLKTTVIPAALDPRRRWRWTNLANRSETGILTARDVQAGFSMTVNPGELKLIRLIAE